MKLLLRNLTEFEYLPYTGTDTDLNSDNEHTGEHERVYGTPVAYKGNISSPSGSVNTTFYGDDIRYTHTLVMDDPNVEFDEYGLISFGGNLYSIQAIRRSLNSVSIALKRNTKNNVIIDDSSNANDSGDTDEEPESDGE